MDTARTLLLTLASYQVRLPAPDSHIAVEPTSPKSSQLAILSMRAD